MSAPSSALSDFILQYQVSPIILIGGLANQQGGPIPIVYLTTGGSIQNLQQAQNTDLDDLIKFDPMPGATLIDQLAAVGPTANQQVAGNATVTQPLGVSMLMTAPASGSFPYKTKLSVFTSMQKKLAQHNALGGLYTVATPAYIWTPTLLLRLTDVSGGGDKQKQTQWRWDFSQPLLTQDDVQGALNGLMQRLTNGTPPSSTPGGSPGLAVGQPVNMLLTGTDAGDL